MKIIIHLADDDFNFVAGDLGSRAVMDTVKADPLFFVSNATSIEVSGYFGRLLEERA